MHVRSIAAALLGALSLASAAAMGGRGSYEYTANQEAACAELFSNCQSLAMDEMQNQAANDQDLVDGCWSYATRKMRERELDAAFLCPRTTVALSLSLTVSKAVYRAFAARPGTA
ncbi:MAG: hypothetical protein M1829_000277 [Trizodia sp. TS-e1964]|nr:MAG: hypothetical protein M1829_000277 [Trizodia sp. TS-e1964]